MTGPEPWRPDVRIVAHWRDLMIRRLTDPAAAVHIASYIAAGMPTLVAEPRPDNPFGITPYPGIDPDDPVDRIGSATALTIAETHTMDAARLWFVDANITDLVTAVCDHSPPRETFNVTRAPSLAGFLAYETPIDVPDPTDGQSVYAVSWAPYDPADDAARGILWRYRNPDGTPGPRAIKPGIRFGIYAADSRPDHDNTNSILWCANTIIEHGTDLADHVVPSTTGESKSVGEIIGHVYTTWQTMTQLPIRGRPPITMTTTGTHATRAERRRADKTGRPIPTINVVTLHPSDPNGSTAGTPRKTDRRVSVRYPVRAHRRSQCGNTRLHATGECDHTDIIVPTHIRGLANDTYRRGTTITRITAPTPDEENPTP